MYYRLVATNPIEGVDQSSWTLRLPATIGRNPEHEVSINHESISRTHCRLALNGDGALTVRDLNSMNGTYVDDNRVKRSVLNPGDILQLGAIAFRVEYVTELEDQAEEKPVKTYDLTATKKMTAYRPSVTRHPPIPPPAKKWWRFWDSD